MEENVEHLKQRGPSLKSELPGEISTQPNYIKILKGTISEKQKYELNDVYYLEKHNKNEVIKKFLKANIDVIKHIDEAELKMIVGKNGFEWTKILEQEKENIIKNENKIVKLYNKIKNYIYL